ncbi:MAG: hypothetical protein ACR2P0_01050 [Acidimicrobiales bacterium]
MTWATLQRPFTGGGAVVEVVVVVVDDVVVEVVVEDRVVVGANEEVVDARVAVVRGVRVVVVDAAATSWLGAVVVWVTAGATGAGTLSAGAAARVVVVGGAVGALAVRSESALSPFSPPAGSPIRRAPGPSLSAGDLSSRGPSPSGVPPVRIGSSAVIT